MSGPLRTVGVATLVISPNGDFAEVYMDRSAANELVESISSLCAATTGEGRLQVCLRLGPCGDGKMNFAVGYRGTTLKQ